MQDVNFGLVEDSVVYNGDPVFDPQPRLVHEIKFSGENGPRREIEPDNLPVKTITERG